jgi:hypothetical protein
MSPGRVSLRDSRGTDFLIGPVLDRTNTAPPIRIVYP